jgi:prepilin-type N-terminal cleavage/methylation domain-containing protein
MRLLLLKQNGFSLTELLVALVVSGVLIIGVVGGYIVQKGTYEAEASLRDMQLNGRLAMDQVARVIRDAGLGCRDNFSPSGDDVVQGAFRTASAVFSAQNRTDGPDTLTAATGLASRTRVQADASGTVVRLENVDGLDATTGRYICIAPSDGNRFQEILSLSGQDVTVSTSSTVHAGDKVFQVNVHTITLDQESKSTPIDVDGDGSTDDSDGDQIPDLAIDDNLTDLDEEALTEVAEGIEDIQFQFGWDADENGFIDPAEYVNDPTGNEEQIRAVRVFILARSVLPDAHYTDPNPSYTIADHTINLDTNDANGIDSDFDHHYHRQLLIETVMVRNRNL